MIDRAYMARLYRMRAWEREASRPGRRPSLETIRNHPGVEEVVPMADGLAVRFDMATDHDTMLRVGSMAIRARD